MSGGQVAWLSTLDPVDAFPPVGNALREPNGLLVAGGDLSIERLLYAYRSGIFPWYEDGQPLLWWSPDPRCVFLPGDFRASRRFRQELRNSPLSVRTNTAFSAVIHACAGPRRSEQGTWITTDIRAAFENLHAAGWAHSIEVWDGDELVGGLYGLGIGAAFFGESMFSHRPNTSKYALAYLDRQLQAGFIDLLDCQVESAHLVSLGAKTLPRETFITCLQHHCAPASRLPTWPSPLPASELLGDQS